MTLKNAFTPPAIGDSVVFRKTMTVAEQAMFTGISGNLGGLYVDRISARKAGLGDAAVFELAAASLWTTCLSRMAGHGYRIAAIQTAFDMPATVGETLEASATLREQAQDELTFDLGLRRGDKDIGRGEAVLVPVREG